MKGRTILMIKKAVCWFRGHRWNVWRSSQQINDRYEVERVCHRCRATECRRVNVAVWFWYL